MFNLLLNSTFWFTLISAIVLLLGRVRGRDATLWWSRASTSRVAWLGLLAGSSVYLGFSFYLGYVVPRDVLQDIVAAQEFQQGRSMHPENLSRRIREALAIEPAPFSFGAWSPRLAELERDQLQRVLDAHWVQAHPPPMTLLISPLVKTTGLRVTCLAIHLISLIALLLTLVMIHRGLDFPIDRYQTLMLAILVVGWHPVGAAFRHGQSGLLLAALMTAGWLGLRNNRSILAGIAIGVATSLKLYPGLLLVYLLVQHRKSFAAAIVTILGIVTATGCIAGWDQFVEYFRTAGFVSEEYGVYPSNLSLLSLLLRTASEFSFAPALARAGFVVLDIVLVMGLMWIVRPRKNKFASATTQLNLEFSLCLTLMPLLSPIAWNHFLTIALLPLAVLWRSVSRNTRSRLSFVGLLLVLTAPEQVWPWVTDTFSGRVPSLLLILLQSFPTITLAGLSGWLAFERLKRIPSSRPFRVGTQAGRSTIESDDDRAGDTAEGHASVFCRESIGVETIAEHEAFVEPHL